jgi:membrane associated rhomboid family serine protease
MQQEHETNLDTNQSELANNQSNSTLSSRISALSTPVAILVSVLAILWIVELADWLVQRLSLIQDFSLDVYGIHPRTKEGLWQIFTAPFLHADFRHLIANSIPLLVLGYMVIIRDRSHFALIFVITALVSGLGIWLLGGSNTIHIGASGVVFGFMGYLLGRGYFERSFVSILFGVIALFLYGGILIGVLPGQEGVSWLGHLFGLAGGVLVAYLVHRFQRRKKTTEVEIQQVPE